MKNKTKLNKTKTKQKTSATALMDLKTRLHSGAHYYYSLIINIIIKLLS